MSNIESTLRGMLQDLSRHHRGRKQLLIEYVNSRLDKSLKSYYNELMSTYEMLSRRNATRVLKRLLSEEET